MATKTTKPTTKKAPAKAAEPKKASVTTAKPKKASSTKARPLKPVVKKAAVTETKKKAGAPITSPKTSAASGRMTPAAYAWAAIDGMLARHADELVDSSGRRVYIERGRETAILSLVGEQLILDFEPPTAMGPFEKKLSFFTATPKRRGWLRFTRPATRDPRPALEAGLGAILGTAMRERNPPPTFRSIVSAGGPYVCMEVSRVPSWGGACDRREFPIEAALYEKALRGPDSASLLAFGDGAWFLTLGTPDPLYAIKTPRGGLFARAVSHSMSDQAIERCLDRAPTEGWEPLGQVTIREPIRAFDVADFGGAIGEGNSLTIALSKGPYEVAHRTWHLDPDTELLLLRFTASP